jgi:hypothetical protein
MGSTIISLALCASDLPEIWLGHGRLLALSTGDLGVCPPQLWSKRLAAHFRMLSVAFRWFTVDPD